ncbi:hypothetical protein UlMin_013381 [Ulmus minor]
MEKNGNIFQIEEEEIVNGKGKGKGKSPTRLQLQAPATLELDQISVSNPFLFPNHEEDEPSSKPIPLLSPLVLSPSPLALEGEEKMEDDDGSENNREVSLPTEQSEVEAPSTDSSSLFSFFQSQCMIVNQAQ